MNAEIVDKFFEAMSNRDVATHVCPATRSTLEVWESVEGQVDLAGAAAELVAVQLLGELSGELLPANEPKEGEFWLEAADDLLGREGVSVGQNYAGGAPVLDFDVIDGAVCFKLRTKMASSCGYGFTNCAIPSFCKTPGS